MLGCELLEEVKAVETVCNVLDKVTAGREMGAGIPVGGNRRTARCLVVTRTKKLKRTYVNNLLCMHCLMQ